MAIDIIHSLEIIETMENYISKVRPPEKIRHQVDISYEISDQSIILNEIRPNWKDPKTLQTIGYAKATFVGKKNLWKIFWQRSDLNWHAYKPQPTVSKLNDFLRIVDEDEYGCFHG
jgi:Protein of unknown function (DUF3024)